MKTCSRLGLATVLALGCPALYADGPRFEISYPKQMSAGPLDGRVMLVIASNDKPEPRFQISFTYESAQAFGVDVDQLGPETAAVIDVSALGYPKDSLSHVPAGDYYVQGFLEYLPDVPSGQRTHREAAAGQGRGAALAGAEPGNLYSKPGRCIWNPGRTRAFAYRGPKKVRRIPPSRGTTEQLGEACQDAERSTQQILGKQSIWAPSSAARWMGRASRCALPGDR